VTSGLATSWDPDVATLPSTTFDSVTLSGGAVLVGGSFVSVGGQNRSNIAAIDTSTAEATAWKPGADAPVTALAVSGETVYAGGQFSNVGGQARSGLAAVISPDVIFSDGFE